VHGLLIFCFFLSFIVSPEWIYFFFDPETPVVLVTDPAASGGDPKCGGAGKAASRR
jgi:hypothetical protein